jgi:hypothetical protein
MLYEGLIVKKANTFLVVILKLDPNEPNCDTVREFETQDEQEANIWLDDEMARLTTGKGVWDI